MKCSLCKWIFHASCVQVENNVADQFAILEKRGCRWFCEACGLHDDNLVATNRELTAKIDDMMATVAKLNDRVSAMESSKCTSDVTDLIEEIEERKRRLVNLIFYGLKEGDSESVDERKKHDRNSVEAILSKLGCTVDVAAIHRLGLYQKNSDRTRLCKVILLSKDEKAVLDAYIQRLHEKVVEPIVLGC